MTTFTQPSKNITSFTEQKRSDIAFWGDTLVSWGDTEFNWGNDTTLFSQPSKNITTFSQPTKS